MGETPCSEAASLIQKYRSSSVAQGKHMRYAHAARTALSSQPSAYFIQKLKGKHLGVGHAGRVWPRYANNCQSSALAVGHATRMADN
ncbi:hypothetical protein [Moorena sp. SIO4G3]|uniref:hypothetical protein n=1 Tax=Moorena sp. SIO4G3 TaxID=2607821 RepID=UPI001428E15E|nr:hypothetical protein [Moorena sp. SIO4G3]NEO82145.1 hypothetical protein [Moorena sp. SIO4G3]